MPSDKLYCIEDGCTRRAVSSLMLCRKHLREDRRTSERHFAETWDAAAQGEVEWRDRIRSPQYWLKMAWEVKVRDVVGEIAAGASLERIEALVEGLPALLRDCPAGDPIDELMNGSAGGEVRSSLSRV